MKRIALFIAGLAAIGMSIAAGAQEAREQSGPARPLVQKTPGEMRQDMLDSLFARLQKATSAQESQVVEAAIWELWMKSDSPTAEILLAQAVKALSVGEQGACLAILDRLIKVHPEFAEAWNKRATVYFIAGRYTDSLADIRHVLDLEPRHFGALSGLGMIRREQGDLKGALAAFRDALALNPQLEGAKQAVEELSANERDI